MDYSSTGSNIQFSQSDTNRIEELPTTDYCEKLPSNEMVFVTIVVSVSLIAFSAGFFKLLELMGAI